MSSQPTTPRPSSSPTTPTTEEHQQHYYHHQREDTTPTNNNGATIQTSPVNPSTVGTHSEQQPQHHQEQMRASSLSTTGNYQHDQDIDKLGKRTRQAPGLYSVAEPGPKFAATKYGGNLFAVDRNTV